MKSYSRSQVTGRALLVDLTAHLSQERTAMAEALADIAEIETRGLYRGEGYPSMYAFCVGKYHMSEQAALKRIYAARTARQFPTIFTALADGHLNLTAVVTLASKLTAANADELLSAASHKSKLEIERLLAERFPSPDLPTVLTPLATPLELSPGRVAENGGLSPGRVEESRRLSPGGVEFLCRSGKITPLSAESTALQVTVTRSTEEKIRRVRDLLGHRLPSGNLAALLDMALDALIEKLEKRKFGKTERPRKRVQESKDPRHIPARVRRAVYQRDGGRCTFVAEGGHRCEARRDLEFDHIEPVARGGESTVANLRLRCRAHNQYAAERTYGVEFMKSKREEARREAGETRDRAKAEAEARKRKLEELIYPLRKLGFTADEARRAAAHCESLTEASMEARIRAALAYLVPRRAVSPRMDTGDAMPASP